MTMMLDLTVGEVVAQIPAAECVFEKHGIDYCCGGRRRFEDACLLVGASPAEIEAEIADAAAFATEPPDWNRASLRSLIRYITSTHHVYLRAELPAIERLIENIARHRGARHPETLPALRRAFERLSTEIQEHMQREEALLFPEIARLEAGRAKEGESRPAFGSVRNPIWMMEQEHETVLALLREIRELTEEYKFRETGCEMFRVLCQTLQALEADLHAHIHLENNILFPRAARLEREGRG